MNFSWLWYSLGLIRYLVGLLCLLSLAGLCLWQFWIIGGAETGIAFLLCIPMIILTFRDFAAYRATWRW